MHYHGNSCLLAMILVDVPAGGSSLVTHVPGAQTFHEPFINKYTHQE